jgi:hypothetical protein
MTLHLIKLCVGVSEVSEMEAWVNDSRESHDHVTRMFPKRKDEILDGGSLYWVIRGMVLVRQPILDLEPVMGMDGIGRCRIVLANKLILVRPTPRRAFQGWRYLPSADAPTDFKSQGQGDQMSEAMRRDLAELGLL